MAESPPSKSAMPLSHVVAFGPTHLPKSGSESSPCGAVTKCGHIINPDSQNTLSSTPSAIQFPLSAIHVSPLMDTCSNCTGFVRDVADASGLMARMKKKKLDVGSIRVKDKSRSGIVKTERIRR